MYWSQVLCLLWVALTQVRASVVAPKRNNVARQHHETDKLGATASESAVCSTIGVNLLKDGGNAADAWWVQWPVSASLACITVASAAVVSCLFVPAMDRIPSSTSERLRLLLPFRTCTTTTLSYHCTGALQGMSAVHLWVQQFMVRLEGIHRCFRPVGARLVRH